MLSKREKRLTSRNVTTQKYDLRGALTQLPNGKSAGFTMAVVTARAAANVKIVDICILS